jgi:hypothetical protein
MPDLTDLVAENYPRIATDLLAPLLELLRLSREFCGGDLDKFLVIMVVALRTTAHREFARFSSEQLLSGEVPVFPGLGTNARSIASSLGLPKETVRRKVCELISAGWLVRRSSRLYFTARAYQQLAPVREQIERLAVANHRVIAGLCAASVQGRLEQ